MPVAEKAGSPKTLVIRKSVHHHVIRRAKTGLASAPKNGHRVGVLVGRILLLRPVGKWRDQFGRCGRWCRCRLWPLSPVDSRSAG